MVSAAAANRKAFGVDRAANPWADMLDAQVKGAFERGAGSQAALSPYHFLRF